MSSRSGLSFAETLRGMNQSLRREDGAPSDSDDSDGDGDGPIDEASLLVPSRRAPSSAARSAGSSARSGDGDPGMEEEETPTERYSLRYCTSAFLSLSLGTLGLGGLCDLVCNAYLAPHFGDSWKTVGFVLQASYAVIGLIPMAIFVAKSIRHPWQLVLDSIDTRPHGCLISSGTMAVAVVAGCLHSSFPSQHVLACTVWFVGLILHLVLMINFTVARWRQRHDFYWSSVTSAWFVVYVGTCNFAANAFTPHGTWLKPWAALVPLLIGLASLAWQLPLVSYRLLFKGPMTPDVLPTVGIYMAPASLCTAGWAAARPILPERIFWPVAWVLLALTCFTAGVIFTQYYPRMFFSVPPRPNWASYTFPTVIFAVALVRMSVAVQHGAAADDAHLVTPSPLIPHALSAGLAVGATGAASSLGLVAATDVPAPPILAPTPSPSAAPSPAPYPAWVHYALLVAAVGAVINTLIVVNIVLVFGFLKNGRAVGVLYIPFHAHHAQMRKAREAGGSSRGGSSKKNGGGSRDLSPPPVTVTAAFVPLPPSPHGDSVQ